MSASRKPTPASEGPFVTELRSALADDGRSLRELAEAAAVDDASLRRFTNRERSLSLPVASRLAAVLGLRVIRSAKGRRPAPAKPGGESSGDLGPGID